MNKKVSVFLPTRKGSERVKNKNTRDFSGVSGGLLAIKIGQLLSTSNIDEVVLSTNDDESIEIASQFDSEKLKIVKRPEYLALSTTDLIDLVKYVPTVCTHDTILWTHVTSPFTKSINYQKAIQTYFYRIEKGKFDSLMSGRWFQNFLWDEKNNRVSNKSSDLKWPRTQDLTKLFEIDSAIFISSKELYLKCMDRIGFTPYLFEQDFLSSFDIDWEEDFSLAEQIFNVK